ncbi:hypothetical protein D3C75_1177070 [compost metagenome]
MFGRHIESSFPKEMRNHRTVVREEQDDSALRDAVQALFLTAGDLLLDGFDSRVQGGFDICLGIPDGGDGSLHRCPDTGHGRNGRHNLRVGKLREERAG